jgi:hypothetical protein
MNYVYKKVNIFYDKTKIFVTRSNKQNEHLTPSSFCLDNYPIVVNSDFLKADINVQKFLLAKSYARLKMNDHVYKSIITQSIKHFLSTAFSKKNTTKKIKVSGIGRGFINNILKAGYQQFLKSLKDNLTPEQFVLATNGITIAAFYGLLKILFGFFLYTKNVEKEEIYALNLLNMDSGINELDLNLILNSISDTSSEDVELLNNKKRIKNIVNHSLNLGYDPVKIDNKYLVAAGYNKEEIEKISNKK